MKKLTLLVWLLMVATAFADGTSGGGGGGGGGGAPVDSTYFVKTSDSGISAENVVQTDGSGVSVTYNTVPDPDTVTFALDVADNITWTGTWTNQGIFLNSAASSFASSVTLNAAGYLIGLGTTEAQATCAAGGGCIFYEQSSDKWRVSQNGGSYADLVQAGGTDLTAVDFLTGAATGLLSAENVVTDSLYIDTVMSGGTAVFNFPFTATQGANPAIPANGLIFGTNGLIFEGATDNTVEGFLTLATLTGDRAWTFPDAAGTIVLTGQTGNVDGTMILDNTVTGTDIALASQATGDIMRYNGTDWVRIAAGAEDDILTIASGQPAWIAGGGGGEGCSALLDVPFMVAVSDASLTEEQVITDGDGIAWTTGTVPDPDTITANVIADGVTITASSGVGTDEVAVLEDGVEDILDLQDLQGAVTDAQVPNTITVNTAAAATALAANGGNCSAGSYPLGVDASGAVESCTVAGTSSPTTLVHLLDEFMANASTTATGDLNFVVGVNGTGASLIQSATLNDENHIGVAGCDTGTTSTGRCNFSFGVAAMALTGGAVTVTWLTRLEDLSAVADEYIYRIGLGDSTTADFQDGVYFQYDRLNAATPGNWYAKVAGGNSRTQCDGDGDEGGADGVDGTPVAVAADTWYRLTAEINTAATSVVFKVSTSGGADVTICTITGVNIPTVSEKLSPYISIIASAYTAIEKAFYVDYFEMSKVVAR